MHPKTINRKNISSTICAESILPATTKMTSINNSFRDMSEDMTILRYGQYYSTGNSKYTFLGESQEIIVICQGYLHTNKGCFLCSNAAITTIRLDTLENIKLMHLLPVLPVQEVRKR